MPSVVESALYSPDGFYEQGGQAGRQGHFVTSAEVGPLFGILVGRALDREWERMGQPDPFVVVEAGAGPGTLARAVVAGRPHCERALRYVLVERSAAQRGAHGERLALEDSAFAFAPAADDDENALPPPAGPIVVSLSEMPRLEAPAVVLANELLDNMPFDLAQRTVDGWDEVRIGARNGDLVEMLVPLDSRRAEMLRRLVPEAVAGARVPLQDAAAAWLRDARSLGGAGGAVIAVDYASTTADLAQRPWLEWVRTYRQQTRGEHPLADLGGQDITCEVAMDQLAAVEPPARVRRQADWLADLGLDELVEDGRRTWSERAHIGDLEAVRGRSRIGEAEALTDPNGLGAFRVMEWHDR